MVAVSPLVQRLPRRNYCYVAPSLHGRSNSKHPKVTCMCCAVWSVLACRPIFGACTCASNLALATLRIPRSRRQRRATAPLPACAALRATGVVLVSHGDVLAPGRASAAVDSHISRLIRQGISTSAALGDPPPNPTWHVGAPITAPAAARGVFTSAALRVPCP